MYLVRWSIRYVWNIGTLSASAHTLPCCSACFPGGCSSFHVAPVPGSDRCSLPAALWAASSHPGAHTSRQAQVSTYAPCMNVFSPCCAGTLRWLWVGDMCVAFFFLWLLRGDYRTGKRLNMRKVIPYIASQFRKDKIWLRRTKPSKREYQICLAVDDSSSMVDNHSKQVAQPCCTTGSSQVLRQDLKGIFHN